MKKAIKRIAVTGGAGQIAYSLIFRIASGDLLGKDQPIALHILEVPEVLKALEGVKMELEDGAFPLLKEIHIGSDPYQLFRDVDIALLVGAKPRGPGMERKDLLQDNGKIFVEQGRALHEVSHSQAHVFVVGNPCNTNCLIAQSQGHRIPRNHFYAMTRLDQNRAAFQLAKKGQRFVDEITKMTIWGNHSSTLVPDFVHAKIKGQPVLDVIKDRKWLEGEFMTKVQKRGAEIIEQRGKSSAASAAQALIQAVQDRFNMTSNDTWYSAAISSEGNPYGIDEQLIFSFPCITKQDQSMEIVQGLEFDDFLKAKIAITEKELIEERELIKNFI